VRLVLALFGWLWFTIHKRVIILCPCLPVYLKYITVFKCSDCLIQQREQLQSSREGAGLKWGGERWGEVFFLSFSFLFFPFLSFSFLFFEFIVRFRADRRPVKQLTGGTLLITGPGICEQFHQFACVIDCSFGRLTWQVRVTPVWPPAILDASFCCVPSFYCVTWRVAQR